MAARAEQHTNHALGTHGSNCTISRNTAEANGGGIGNAGGVFIGNGSAFVMRGSAEIRDNSFTAKEGSRLATPSGAGGVYTRTAESTEGRVSSLPAALRFGKCVG